MDIWGFQRQVTSRLLTWAGISAVLGVVIAVFRPHKFWRGVAGQFVGWAAINALIGLAGGAGAKRREETLRDAHSRSRMTTEAHNLSRLLWINAALDVLYIAGGARFGASRADDDTRAGTGVGIMIQGAFLLVFDIVHGLAIRPLLERGYVQRGRARR